MLFVNASRPVPPTVSGHAHTSRKAPPAPKPPKAVHLSKPVKPDHMTALREAFAEFDKNSDGYITKNELAGVMANFGHEIITQEELDEVMKLVDTDGNGVVDFKEFLELMDSNTLIQDADDEVKSLFTLFDIDHDGYITEKEIGNVMKNLGEKVRKKDIRKMVKEADKNKDGKISFSEFQTMVESGHFMGCTGGK